MLRVNAATACERCDWCAVGASGHIPSSCLHAGAPPQGVVPQEPLSRGGRLAIALLSRLWRGAGDGVARRPAAILAPRLLHVVPSN